MIFNRKYPGLVCALILLLNGYSYAQQLCKRNEILFKEGNLDAALSAAKQQHKPVFVDAYAVWCAPCQQLKQNTFKDKALSAYCNSHFINISIDVEKGDGEKFAEHYNVNNYPTLLFIDEDGKIITRIEGFVEAKSLLKAAESIKL
ncbi:thioredoxin fold domain-containing protein [Mucilaginibacter sp. SG564]|uniref:thioredoxin family protein n=1 Tax=Mucilaginibacter sp. SG564 TaxID=2587022 RepID=UPI001552232A|nr:thioredoxin fold domain-containing protein [Mucilaginibacter sp. SG564]NOW96071.1 thiol:disulfide interchange protein [Mucilaginibacter sp. SG564]